MSKDLSQESKYVIHKASARGHANHGWLDARHSFSFANYYDAHKIHFGAIRVLNDDVIAAGKGFGMHPHNNMEIITIPLEGALAHEDSMGNASVIQHGEIQVMSAGTGVQHSEFNNSNKDVVKTLQIWIFPNKENVTPRYAQHLLPDMKDVNKLIQILSPDPDGDVAWIHQDAWFYLGRFEENTDIKYDVKKEGNGAYIFVIKGRVDADNHTLLDRDALGVWDTHEVSIKAHAGSTLLIMDVPMHISTH
ncbi:MAG: pirin family protein [Saprospiraceae bacterium]|nr:pirin family protein [Saprospiraceae bacterium]